MADLTGQQTGNYQLIDKLDQAYFKETCAYMPTSPTPPRQKLNACCGCITAGYTVPVEIATEQFSTVGIKREDS